MTVAVKNAQYRCGFCADGFHERCPGGCRNGNGSVHKCRCSDCEFAGRPRCLTCNHRDPRDLSENWECLDKNECAARVEAALAANPTVQLIRAARAAVAAAAAEAPDKPVRVSAPTRPSSGKCRCCGEATKGGNFLPGHDARYLARLASRWHDASNFVIDEDRDVVRQDAYSVSPAFGAKFDRKVGIDSRQNPVGE